ncbi:MarR family winged helix-turn-helix transcriptional regulator [Fodinicola feengrottensis]|uniref:MarR family transcriptional regulator n=1 Tax=Fodinicola feengrottensis TaxID=435914 RepID=A0ABP4T9Y7_9ACTN|nr:MarR family transcriptional regulator [Fodinicola feengrottensis]
MDNPLLGMPMFATVRLGRIARATVSGAFDQEGLSWRTHFALYCLTELGELSQRELADHLTMDRSDLVKMLDEVETAGLVRRAPDPSDRRRRILSITAAGKDQLQRGKDVVDRATDEFLAHLNGNEREQLHQLTLRAIGA